MTRRLQLDDLWDFAVPSSPAISPDGGQVAYVLRTADRETDRNRRAIWMVDAAGGEPVRLTTGWADASPVWSPDGTRLAFLRAGDGPGELDGPARRLPRASSGSSPLQVWILPMGGGEPGQVTELPLGAGAPVWSPDGRRLAFTAPVGRPAATGPVVVDRLGYKADGLGLRGNVHQHLHVLDLESGEVRQLTDGSWDASPPAWSPDGTRLAFTAAMTPDADLTLVSAAYVVDVTDPGPPRQVGPAKGHLVSVTWSPEGSGLVAVGMTTMRIGHASLLWLPIDGAGPSLEAGEPLDLAATLDRNVLVGGPEWPGGSPTFDRDGRIHFTVRDRGATHVYRVDVGGGPPEPMLADPRVSMSGLSVAPAAGVAATVVGTGSSYGEIALLDLEAGGEPAVLTKLTRLAGTALPDVDFLPLEEREFAIGDGSTVHGWLVRDPAATGPQPLLLDIHGGPHLAWGPHAEPAHPYHQVLAGQGWTVLLLNPRGSDGYGESFYAASVESWGIGDERELLEPVEQLVAEGLADPDRLAVCGYSYGGFATCHLTTRTGRFAAAVAGGPVTDLVSMAGTSDQSRIFAVFEFGDDVYRERTRTRAQSPIERVEQVTTPTLVVHAVNDERCPIGQAEEWFAALRSLGVETQMVLYPGESHQFMADGTPSCRIDYSRQIVRWVTTHVPA